MAPISTEAIVLQAFPYSETSKVLRLLTREHGVHGVIAKGALRPRSRFSGVLDPFAQGVATLRIKQGRELQTLEAFELTHSGQALARDLIRFGAAALLSELVTRTASEERDPELFDQLRAALLLLESAPAQRLEAIALAECWALVSRLGFAPELERCLACGRSLDAGEDAVFDYDAGSVRCRPCAGGAPGRDLPAAARAALRQLCRGEAPTIERTAAHWALLRKFLAYHVLEGGSVRSLAFLTEALEAG